MNESRTYRSSAPDPADVMSKVTKLPVEIAVDEVALVDVAP